MGRYFQHFPHNLSYVENDVIIMTICLISKEIQGTIRGCRSYIDMRNHLAKLTDLELTASLKALVKAERSRSVDILKHLNEMDRRHVAERSGFPSLFEYCVRELRYVNGTAARLIHAARAAKRFEILYKTMDRGLLSVTTVSMLAPHLKWDNHRKLIRKAAGKSAREVEALLSSLNPVAAAPAERIRILTVAPPSASAAATDELFPAPSAASARAASVPEEAAGPASEPAFLTSGPAAAVAPTESSTPVESAASKAPETEAKEETAPSPGPPPPPPPVRRAFFSFTADEAFLRDFERAKELSRHRWPTGRQEDVFSGALKVLLEKIDPDRRRRRKDRARRLAAGSRRRDISRAVKDEVWSRDGGRCSFRADAGRVCGARAGLEFDHVKPWALGGGSGDASNVRLLCRAHNDLEARRVFGSAYVDAAVARRKAALRREVKI